jgi:hypothetical protein
MVPVVSAPTLAAARQAMGITDAIQVETDRALAAEQALQNELSAYGTVSSLNAEVTRAEAAEAHLQTEIDAEKARAMAAEAALGAALPTFQSGFAQTDSSGAVTVTFTTPFATACTAVVCSSTASCWNNVNRISRTSFDVVTTSPLFGGNWQRGPIGFYWVATGH